MSAGPHARDDRGGKLAAGNEPHEECAEAERFMHMQRQDRQRRPDDEESDEYRRHNGQQRCDRPAAARDLEERSTSETNDSQENCVFARRHLGVPVVYLQCAIKALSSRHRR